MTPNSSSWFICVLLVGGVTHVTPHAGDAEGPNDPVRSVFSATETVSATTTHASAGLSKAHTIAAVRGLLHRLLPAHTNYFVVEVIAPDARGDVFEIESRDGKIVLRGNTGVSIASALNWYLKYNCGCHHSFTGGSQLQLPEPLPEVPPKVRRVSSARYRYFLNYCCFGYSLPWFDWAQWEKLIDWMALNGINLPLSVTGQEAVWQAVGHRLGWTDRDLQAFLAGPPYLPFGWMGCLDGHGGPLSQTWIDAHVALQRRILQRERQFGMRPVLQGFTGHVPGAITNQVAGGNVQKITWIEWQTHLLNPIDPLFPRIAAAFMEEQQRLFGTDHFYAADTFIEMTPPSGDTNYLAAIGRAIFNGITATDRDAVWVLQGWPFFYNRGFWTQPRIEAVLAPVPNQQMIVLDLYCEKTPVWSRTGAFCGKPWVWCNIQNFGDRVWLGGALDLINRDYFAALSHPDAGQLSGLGFVNEGLDHNPVVYDLMFELAWRGEPVSIEAWLRDFVRRSYGKANSDAEKGWQALHETAFQAAFDNSAACTMAPSLTAPPAAPYSNARLVEAWKHLLDAAEAVGSADPFRFDLVNVTRQVLANHSAEIHRMTLDAFKAADQQALRRSSQQMIELIRDLDELLATRQEFLLGKWLEDARRWGTTEAERNLLEWNARRVLTLWGNTTALRDYSCRQWSGLLSGFHLKRWELFYRRLDQALATARPFDDNAFESEMFEMEKDWCDLHDRYDTQARGDSVAVSRRLWAKHGTK